MMMGLREIRALKRRFQALNRDRVERTRDSLRGKQTGFLDLLPLMFHVNHPLLPGYISKETPAGISDYSPSARAVKVAKKMSKSFSVRKRALFNVDIYSMFIMGSSGTIAYSEGSDFDIWICHRPEIKPEALSELRQKATAVEAWAADLDIQAHFFLMDADSFKAGHRVSLSSESSGSAQHHLLLEEFYRTGLLLAGRYPLWWLVPVEQENDYDGYVHELLRKGFVRKYEYVDFGGLASIPPEEFFGAALWQLYKAIDSPYKSLLKIFLMEAYAQEYPRSDLLSRRFKQAVYEGEKNLSHLDPYVMLYQKIEEYFRSRGEDKRIDLLRRCFYFKVDERITKLDVKLDDLEWRKTFMIQLIRTWEWGDAYLQVLNSRPSWKVTQVLQERSYLVNELTDSYKFLSNFGREYGQLATINQRDLNILGRKLFAAFERRAEKIELINHGISDNLWESHLSLHQISGTKGHHSWAIYRGIVNYEEATRETSLKRAYSVLGLLVWCHFNGLIDSRSVITLYTNDSALSTKEIYALVECMQRLFPESLLKETRMEAFEKSPRPLVTVLFANIGVDPMHHRTREGKLLTSNKTDALSYSGLQENLVQTLDQVVATSWQEVETYRYIGDNCMFDCLCDYFRRVPPSKGAPLPRVSAHSFSSMRGSAIGQRIEQLFADVMQYFYDSAHADLKRYIVKTGTSYTLLSRNGDVLEYERLSSLEKLHAELARGRTAFSPIVADRFALTETILPAIFDANRPDVIQVFYHVEGTEAQVYIADERGSIYSQRREFHKRDMLISQFMLFFDAIQRRRSLQTGRADQLTEAVIPVEYYEVTRNKQGGTSLWRSKTSKLQQARSFFNLKVIGNVVADNELEYTIFCDEKEFSSLEYGSDLYRQVAAHVTRLRKTATGYPIYITDVDIPGSVLGAEVDSNVQTIHYLNYKKEVEDRLNKALAAGEDNVSAIDRLVKLVSN